MRMWQSWQSSCCACSKQQTLITYLLCKFEDWRGMETCLLLIESQRPGIVVAVQAAGSVFVGQLRYLEQSMDLL